MDQTIEITNDTQGQKQ
jgi:hypothetical protein